LKCVIAGRRDGLDGFSGPDPDISVCIGAGESSALRASRRARRDLRRELFGSDGAASGAASTKRRNA
jgi:hypothetical protein